MPLYIESQAEHIARLEREAAGYRRRIRTCGLAAALVILGCIAFHALLTFVLQALEDRAPAPYYPEIQRPYCAPPRRHA